jgi:WD40 repeat protein
MGLFRSAAISGSAAVIDSDGQRRIDVRRPAALRPWAPLSRRTDPRTHPPTAADRSGPSIFTPQPIQAVSGRHVSGFAWNLVPSQPLLAVAVEGAASGSRLEGGSVLVLDGEGEPFEDVVIRTREGRANAVQLAWSPPHVQDGSLLAIGWEDGTVMVWSLKDRLARSDQEQHAPHPVSLLLWSPDAERLISGDARQDGASTLAVWKVAHARWEWAG